MAIDMNIKSYASPELVDLGSIAGITAMEGVATQFDTFIFANGSEQQFGLTGSIDGCTFVVGTGKCVWPDDTETG